MGFELRLIIAVDRGLEACELGCIEAGGVTFDFKAGYGKPLFASQMFVFHVALVRYGSVKPVPIELASGSIIKSTGALPI